MLLPDRIGKGVCMCTLARIIAACFFFAASFNAGGLLDCGTLTAYAQSATATLSGTVYDENKNVVPNVNIVVTNRQTSLKRQITTNDEGHFTVPQLPPSTYTVKAEHEGFTPVEFSDVTLNVNDQLTLNIHLKVHAVGETIDVIESAPLIQESPAVATVIDRQFVENLPLNGRSFQSLITLMPGVVLTAANANNQGQFSVNGQRANTNYFTVDGVSANIGISAANVLGQSGGGALPGLSAAGGTNSLVSTDALQEFRIQTSTYAPEFGRTPGAQVSIITRSGTNDFRGAIFEYFRNDALDANDWFNNALRLPKPSLRQNDFGAVLGGPIVKNQAFFFLSYEGLRLRLPQSATTDVPSLSSRQTARIQIQPILNAFPIPNGPELPSGFAKFNASYSDPSTLDAASIRLDHAVNSKLSLFGRYNYAPSETTQRGGATSSLNTLFLTKLQTQTYTIGVTQVVTPKINNDLRFNYSRSKAGSFFTLDDFGGAILPNDSVFFPPFASRDDALYQFSITGTGPRIQLGKNIDNLQRQVNIVDNLSVILGSHQLKFGVDYRRLSPINGQRQYEQFVIFSGLEGANGVIAGNSSNFIVGARDPVTILFTNTSAYGQDTWHISPRSTLTYGLRLEVNSPPRGENGKELFTVQGLNNPAMAELAPAGTALWKTTFNNFAPRIGISYLLSHRRDREAVLRGGVGIFYDLAAGTASTSASNFPYARSRSLLNIEYPLTQISLATPPDFSLTPNRASVLAFDPNLKLPFTYQWNLSVEQSLGSHQTISASYVAAVGRRLLRLEQLQGGTLNPIFQSVSITRNTASSDYQALQLQFLRRLTRGLQAMASYTWSHSIDNFSNDSVPTPPSERIDPQLDRGPSDYDIRHAFNAAVTYNVHFPNIGAIGNILLQNWAIDTIVTARSATPINVVYTRDMGFGSFAFRPDLVSDVPLYIDDPVAPGDKRINNTPVTNDPRQVGPFLIPTDARQGTLQRNALRGFPVYQVNFALRRQFNINERLNLQLRAEFFNIFNQPNFADPSGSLGAVSPSGTFTPTSSFGTSATMFGRSLGSGGVSGGLNPLYQIGGPRSIQLALKLQF